MVQVIEKKALVVEDEIAIAKLLGIHLSQLGFSVSICHNAEDAWELLQTNHYQICLLDWMLPGVQGIEFLKKIRLKFSHLKIMMVTAKTDAESIVEGLESGADDYLAKPFEAQVLLARVRHMMRRLQIENVSIFSDQVIFDDLYIHFTKHIVKHQDKVIHLTPSEFKLLAILYKAQGMVLTRDKLIDLIQGEDVSVTGRTIDSHIFTLRKKIGAWSKHIETIRGVGYRILISEADSSEEKL